MQPEERLELINRLRSAEGHLGAVIGLLEAGKPCEQVLHQLGAVRAALRAAGARLLESQISDCKQVIRNNPCPDEREAELIRLLKLYFLQIQYFHPIERIQND